MHESMNDVTPALRAREHPRRTTEGGAPVTTERVEVGASKMTVDRYGETGAPVLLLHGIPGFRGTFAEVGRRLGESCQVVVPDLLGFGDSDEPTPGAHAAQHAAAILELMSALGIERFHLVGFDFGGPIAVLAARIAPARVASIALAATNVFPDTTIPFPLRIARVPLLGDLFFRIAFGRIGLSMMWLAAVADRVAFPFRRYRQVLRFSRGVAWTRRIFLLSMRDLPGLYTNVERAARLIDVPSAVFWGDKDPFFPVDVGQRTAAAVRGRLHVLEGCGHFVPEERAAATAEGILALVRRADSCHDVTTDEETGGGRFDDGGT